LLDSTWVDLHSVYIIWYALVQSWIFHFMIFFLWFTMIFQRFSQNK
jgi:hypothetical protein